jgi:predicted double-glycine peptidase
MRRALLTLVVSAICPITQFAANADAVRLDVPFIKQRSKGCGSAALAMVIQYWSNRGLIKRTDKAADPLFIQKQLYDSSARATKGSDMQRYLREHGFEAFAIGAESGDLWTHISRGRPVIICLAPGGKSLHYVVVVGGERFSHQVVIHDPQRGAFLRVDFDRFQEAWRATGGWALVAAPKGIR